MPAINHGARTGPTKYIVVHDTEGGTIDSVEAFFRGGANPPENDGAHFGIEQSLIKTVRPRQWADTDTLVYHAIGGNHFGIGIELCGFASYSRTQWLLRRAQRVALAELLARLCHHYGLGQPTHLRNVLTHADVTRLNNVAGGHTDPGKNFPMDAVIKLARKRYHKYYS